MFFSPGIQDLTVYGTIIVFLKKLKAGYSKTKYDLKTEFLYNIGVLLFSLQALAQAISLYVLTSLLTGNWTQNANGISPVRWLACLAFPLMIASRGLHHKTLTSSGALAVLQIGFLMSLANLSFFGVFAAYLIMEEEPRETTKRPSLTSTVFDKEEEEEDLKKTSKKVERRKSSVVYQRKTPKNYLHVLCESGLALQMTLFHMFEIGTAMDNPLDFRSHFLTTWLALTVIASFAVIPAENMIDSALLSFKQGFGLGLGYWLCLFLYSSGVPSGAQEDLGPAAAVQLASKMNSGSELQMPPQYHIIAVAAFGGAFGAVASPVLKDLLSSFFDFSALFQSVGHTKKSFYHKSASYGQRILFNIANGLLLPRMILALDTSNNSLWNSVAALSSYS